MEQRQTVEIRQSLRLKLTTGLRAAIEMLRQDATGLSRYLEEQAAANPSLTLIQPTPRDWLPRWSGVLGAASRARPEVGETAPSPGPSLIAHVTGEIDRRMKTPQDRRIALALAEALDASGWIDRPLSAIAHDLGLRQAQVEAVLTRLQEIEPVGLFARNLAECLRLQAQEAGLFDPVMKLTLSNLDLLGRGEMKRLAQMAGVTEAEVLARFRQIRTMNPKPGTAFDPLMAETLREPDLLTRPRPDGDWEVTLNGSALPELRVGGAGSAESRAAARMLERMVLARNETVLRVGTEVLRRQRAALQEGPQRLQPMTMAEVATSLDLHESTVSRVVAGTSVDTPQGVWWLRKLFSRALGDGNDPMSAAGFRDRLARKIAAEEANAPLSDEALAGALAEELGVTVARRTVAKYRAMLGIPPAHRRRVR
jgi:RNA polymerase sigma-54 factor